VTISYIRNGVEMPSCIKLRDVLFLSHAKPRDAAQAGVWKKLIWGRLNPPDTWEVALSSGADKREAWERLLREQKLGALALLRNLRNMREAGVDESLVLSALETMSTARVLPFRFSPRRVTRRSGKRRSSRRC